MSRDDIVAEARTWVGTPYRHQASEKGIGADCLGLIRGVWRSAIGPEPEAVPPYTPGWAEALREEALLEAAQRHLIEIPMQTAQAGDVLLFRMGLGHPVKHCAILSGDDLILHAYWGRAVCETRLVPWWKRRRAGAFSFPGLTLTERARGRDRG